VTTNQAYSPSVADIGEQIRQARLNASLRQEELALQAGTNRYTVSQVENGTASGISYASLIKLLNVVGLRFAVLPAERPVLDHLLAEGQAYFLEDAPPPRERL
jgi:transcriptional regulator with XRE-family HTH domain